jgi:general secretion pathway protein C
MENQSHFGRNKLAVYLAVAGILLVVGREYFLLTRLLNDDITLASSIIPPLVSIAQPAIETRPMAQFIAERNLFGTPVNIQDQIVMPVELPETNLQLVLQGVVASTITGQSQAMIQGPDGAIANYVPGEAVPGDAVVNSIYKDRVILERRGQMETLFFTDSN